MRKVNEHGFSLIEMLLVLCITMVVFGVITKFSYDYLNDYNQEQIKHEILLKIREMQFLTHANDEVYGMVYQYGKIRIYDNYTEENYFEHKMPPNIDILLHYTSFQSPFIHFRPDLSSRGTASFKYYTKRGISRYTINLGKGHITSDEQ